MLRDLVVLVGGSRRDDAVLTLAMNLARRHGAHVTGFCPLRLLYPQNFGFSLSDYPELVVREVANQLDMRAREASRTLETAFRERLRREDVRGDWQAAAGRAAELVIRRARAADILVLGQADPDNPSPPAGRDLIGDALMQTGRPLLVVPFAGSFDTLGGTVLIGWNGTREAARAVHDALPLITPDAKVIVLTVTRGQAAADPADVPGAEVAEHLARHGLDVSAARTVADGSISDADALLDYAADIGADLLVVGGYGHSRTRETILGGVTRDLLEHMTLPVLMTH